MIVSPITANPRNEILEERSMVSTTIINAYYADLDSDGLEDDIDVIIALNANFEGRFRASFLLTIELPSGLTFKFLLEAWLSISPDITKYLKVTAFNTAIEEGWYTVTLDGQIRGVQLGSFYTSSSFVFDPPTGQGSGNPIASVIVY